VKIAIIADDLTGANDSGAQLVRAGLRTSVMINDQRRPSGEHDAIVFDTDSRAVSGAEAYRRVQAVARTVVQDGAGDIYKKMDSTMRGNIGAELDAMYDVCSPDFVIIAPGFPRNGRQVIDGYHYLNGVPLHQSEAANDPKTPVTESFLPRLLAQQTDRPIAFVTYAEIRRGFDEVKRKLDQFKSYGIPYLIFDSEDESDLESIIRIVQATEYRVVWSGSAGLVSYMPLHGDANKIAPIKAMERDKDSDRTAPVLLAIGSASSESRKQVAFVLQQPDVIGVMVRCDLLVSTPDNSRDEIERACALASTGLAGGAHVALYCASDLDDVAKAQEMGRSHGWSPTEVSHRIAVIMGQMASRLLDKQAVAGIVLTGGDIAKQVITQLGASELTLIGEVETGVPIGRLTGGKNISAVTKAGSFGSERVLWASINSLQMRVGQ
jgi:uncharacterized protein YgbK (DUF1537 family)